MEIGRKAGHLTLKKILGRTPAKDYIGLFECNCGDPKCKGLVERGIKNAFSKQKRRKNPVSCGAGIKSGQAVKREKTVNIDSDLANSFLKGSI